MIGQIIFSVILLLIFFSIGGYLYKRYKPIFQAEYKFHIGFYKVKGKNLYKVKFNKSYDKLKLPMITLNIAGKKANFILDTGAETSILNTKFYDTLDKSKVEERGKDVVYSANGGKTESKEIVTNIKYEKEDYTISCLVTDINDMMEHIGKKNGIKIAGLLGSDFFVNNRWVIDFEEKVVWIEQMK